MISMDGNDSHGNPLTPPSAGGKVAVPGGQKDQMSELEWRTCPKRC